MPSSSTYLSALSTPVPVAFARRHLELIADILKRAKPDMEQGSHHLICHRFAHELSAHNPRFDYLRFMDACGTDGCF